METNIEDTQEFQDALKSLNSGEYEHTMLEAWKVTLEGMIGGIKEKITMRVANDIVRSFPWLTHADVPAYVQLKLRRVEQILEELLASFPEDKTIEELFSENENDWLEHKDIYLEIIARWTNLARTWEDQWDELEFRDSMKALLHAVVSDVITLIAGGNALVNNIKELSNFEIDEADGAWLQKRVEELRSE